ncbi:MAG: DUF924 domain-containing protein [Kangiellaceae bacterium]|nr:DUF924 domain-containing protein [Kangiellaceae bacterium]
MINSQDIINFWFKELKPKQWWVKDPEFDQLLIDKYSDLHQQANAGELSSWRETAEGRLAEIIILDQFSRNMFRDTPQAFASDCLALCLSQWAIASADDKKLSQQQRQFLYMPFMHSESKAIHQKAVELYSSLGTGYGYDFELKHKAIIDKFGRYPHRNKVLGRKSSPQEIEFLKQPNSSF